MTTLRVEALGEELVIRLTTEARTSLALRAGDEVQLVRTVHGEVSLAASDMDHQIRLERSRAFLRHLRQ
jgi:hypothetical protein